MKNWLVFIGILLIIVSFYVMLLSLMNLFPIVIAAPLLYLTIVFTIFVSYDQKRFKGFR